MKQFLTGVAISLPWLVGVPLFAWFCRATYAEGRSFEPGLHFFGWILYLEIGAIAFFPALIFAGTTALLLRDQIKHSRALQVAAGLSVLSLLLPVLILPAMESSFFAGRQAAYKSLDHRTIYEASLELRDRLRNNRENLIIAPREPNIHELPPAIARLSPLEVVVSARAVTIQMDGGGVMYHEGIAIVLAEPGTFSLPEGVERLNESLPVYLYRLYDYRMLHQAVREDF